MSGDKQLDEIHETLSRIKTKMLLLKLILRAHSEYNKLDFASSRQDLIKAYFNDRKNPVIFRGLGCIKHHEGKFDAARRFFKLALKYSDKSEVEYTLIGMTYYAQNDLDEAVKYFNLAIDKNDDYEPAYEGRNQAMLENHLRVVDLQEALKSQKWTKF